MSALDQLPKHARKGRKALGMSLPCPECGIEFSSVLDKRNRKNGIMRRRMCQNGHRFKTAELPEKDAQKVELLEKRLTAVLEAIKVLHNL